MSHKELVDAAKEAINAVLGDTSVTPEENRNSLEELLSEIETLIAVLDEQEEL